MAFVCRACARQAKSLPPTAGSLQTSARHFSQTTSTKSLRLPDFPPSPSPSLNTLLTTLRSDHLMPNFLTPDQKRLVYRSKFRSRLLNNPSTVTIQDTEFDLRPLDRNSLSAARSPLLAETISTLVKDEAWTLLPALLDGLASLRSARHGHVAKLVRQAGAHGQFGQVAHALRGPAWRARLVGNAALRAAVTRGPRQTAEHGGWSKEAVDAAVRQAEDVALSLAGSGVAGQEVVGAWLELHAVRVAKYGGDVEGVKKYYERLRGCVEDKVPKGVELAKEIDGGFMRVLPVWQGVMLAERALGAQAGDLSNFAARCGRELEAAVAELKNKGIKEGSYAAAAVKEYEVAKANIDA